MAHYDNYANQSRGRITKFGSILVEYRNQWYLNKISKFIHSKKNNPEILEIGPGKGAFAREIALKTTWQYSAIEGNRIMADNLKKNNYSVRQGYTPPIGGKTKYDVIFFNQVLEHINPEILSKFVDDCVRHLNKNGLIVLGCPEICHWQAHFFAGDYTHVFPTSIHNVPQLLIDHDLEVLEKGHYTLFFEGSIISSIFSELARFLFRVGVIGLFGKRGYKILTTTLSTCYVIAQKK